MSAYQRTKGANFERWVVNELRARFPDLEINRRNQGAGSGLAFDVECINKPGGPEFRLGIECKVGSSSSANRALIQAQRDREKSGRDWPVIGVNKMDRRTPTIAVSPEDFERLGFCFVPSWSQKRFKGVERIEGEWPSFVSSLSVARDRHPNMVTCHNCGWGSALMVRCHADESTWACTKCDVRYNARGERV